MLMTTDYIYQYWNTTHAGRYLNKSSEQVRVDIRRNLLIGYLPEDGAYLRLPTWQFADGRAKKWVPYLIGAYGMNDQALMAFLNVSRTDGPCYAEQLINGLSKQVILAARQANKW